MPPGSSPDHPTELIRCRITGYSPQTSDAQVHLVRLDRATRTRRALIGIATFWGAALASIFIPVAHFVLVPGFLVYGIVAVRQRLRTEVVAIRIKGSCPDCGFAQQFDTGGRWNPPVETACRQCSRRLVIGHSKA